MSIRFWPFVVGFILLSFAVLNAEAQQTVDGNFSFQTDTAKKYSLYVPSGYQTGTPHKLMLGLHPFNTNRWDSESWRDTLIVFAETNNLLLVCPDGGLDGKIDDPIDTAFTSALLDSVMNWYTIDESKMYAMGFSWGGRTTYTYGLNRPQKFGGFIPIGAAISGTQEVTIPLQLNAAGMPIYIVHGSQDIPNTRFYPVRDSLISKGAIVETNLLAGVGHTIDFPNRNAILTTAYLWIDSVNCQTLSVPEITESQYGLGIYGPSKLQADQSFNFSFELEKEGKVEMEIYDMKGQYVAAAEWPAQAGKGALRYRVGNWPVGTYIVKLNLNGIHESIRIIVY